MSSKTINGLQVLAAAQGANLSQKTTRYIERLVIGERIRVGDRIVNDIQRNAVRAFRAKLNMNLPVICLLCASASAKVTRRALPSESRTMKFKHQPRSDLCRPCYE